MNNSVNSAFPLLKDFISSFQILEENSSSFLFLEEKMPVARPTTGCFFLTTSAQKVLSIRLHSESHQKSSKCQNLLADWHLELFRRNQLKKTPCSLFSLFSLSASLMVHIH